MNTKDLQMIRELAINDFRLRYKNTFLGYVWPILYPMIFWGILYIIYSMGLIGYGLPDYPLFLLLGIIIYYSFTETTTQGMVSLLDKQEYIKNIKFPKRNIVISSNISSFIHLIFNLIIFMLLSILQSMKIHPLNLLIMVLVLASLFLLNLGISLIISSFILKNRDIMYVWRITTMLMFWITPILYSINIVPSRYQILILLNPLTLIIQNSRSLLIDQVIPAFGYILLMIAISLIYFMLGIIIFRVKSVHFSEEL
jgi:lipopolysaccharide transport system permease protein